MNDSVDYQIELHLKNLEDELKSAEQQYLEKIQCIVAKYTNKATQIREESLKQYEEELMNNDDSDSKEESKCITICKQIQTTSKSIDHKMQQTIPSSPVCDNHINQNNVFTKGGDDNDEIEINSPMKSSGYTPIHVQKIRESLKRGQILYEINKNKNNKTQQYQDKENRNNDNKSSIINQDNEEDDDEDDDDDLNIIPLKTWSKKLHVVSDSNNNLNKMEDSHDLSVVSTSPVQIHKDDISDNLSISSLRDSYILSNTLKYGQSNSKFRQHLMVNRLRRKRKYECIDNEHQNDEPPKKKTNIKSIDLMSSRDLKNELKRIHKTKTNTILNRKNLLLRKSVPNLSTINYKQNIRKRNNKIMFNSDTESDDDILDTKNKRK